MKKKKYLLLKERTDSKLRFAQLYLEELKDPKILGSEIEKAHQESFIFHLIGAKDSFLAEINEIYGFGIKAKNLSTESLRSAKSKKPVKEVKKITKLMGKKNWLFDLASFNPNTVQVEEKKEKTKNIEGEVTIHLEHVDKNNKNQYMEKFEEWQEKMSQLIIELRESAISTSGNSSKK